jgi:hypothetical protein
VGSGSGTCSQLVDPGCNTNACASSTSSIKPAGCPGGSLNGSAPSAGSSHSCSCNRMASSRRDSGSRTLLQQAALLLLPITEQHTGEDRPVCNCVMPSSQDMWHKPSAKSVDTDGSRQQPDCWAAAADLLLHRVSSSRR